jgi:hypothetical protein
MKDNEERESRMTRNETGIKWVLLGLLIGIFVASKCISAWQQPDFNQLY